MTNNRSITELYRQTITRGDNIVVIAALILLLALYQAYWGQGSYGAQASIYAGGKFLTTVNLYQNREMEVKGPLGVSRLQIEDGKIRFVDSPCTTKVCIRQGWIESGGESAICLPNGISVQIESPDPLYDSINF